MKYFGFISILFLTFSLKATAQNDSILVKTMLLPNKEYLVTTAISSKTEMDFEANDSIMQKIKSNGVTLPMVMEMDQSIFMTTITGDRDGFGFLKFMTRVDSSISENKINGREAPSQGYLSGLKSFGKVSEAGQITVDSLSSSTMNELEKKYVIQTMQKVFESVKFPEKPISVGDDFSQSLPLTIPFAGLQSLFFEIDIKYKLREIKDSLAYFDLDESLVLITKDQNLKIDSKGSGNGSMIYNINHNYITEYKSMLDIEMTIDVDSILIHSKIHSNSSQLTAISN